MQNIAMFNHINIMFERYCPYSIYISCKVTTNAFMFVVFGVINGIIGFS